MVDVNERFAKKQGNSESRWRLGARRPSAALGTAPVTRGEPWKASAAERLVWGATRGLAFAGLYVAWITLVLLLNGSRIFTDQGVSYVGVVATYVVTGAVTGALVGMLRRLARTRLTAYAIGAIPGIIAAAGVAVLMTGMPWRWDGATWATTLAVGIVGGASTVGSALWREAQERMLLEAAAGEQ
jgi:hypothetical protein